LQVGNEGKILKVRTSVIHDCTALQELLQFFPRHTAHVSSHLTETSEKPKKLRIDFGNFSTLTKFLVLFRDTTPKGNHF